MSRDKIKHPHSEQIYENNRSSDGYSAFMIFLHDMGFPSGAIP